VTVYVHGGVGKHVTMLVDGEDQIDDDCLKLVFTH